MGIGVSVFLLAAGAIMSFAIETDSTEGVNIDTVGLILMAAGAIGLIWSLMVMSRRDRTYVEERPVDRVYERRV